MSHLGIIWQSVGTVAAVLAGRRNDTDVVGARLLHDDTQVVFPKYVSNNVAHFTQYNSPVASSQTRRTTRQGDHRFTDLTSYNSRFLAYTKMRTRLDEEVLNLNLELVNVVLELTALVGGNRARDDGPGDAACASERNLGRDEDVRDVLVLAEEGEVEEDLEGLGVSGHDDHLGDAAVEGLGGLVSALLELLVGGGRLNKVEEGDSELGIREGVGLGVSSVRHDVK